MKRKPMIKSIATRVVEIYIAGSFEKAKDICREYCETGLCVTVLPTDYIYTGGEEAGVVVGLRAYPRFPETDIDSHVEKLAYLLMDGLFQRSAMIVGPNNTIWLSKND